MVSTRLRSEIHALSNGDNTTTQDPPSSKVTAGTSNPVTTTPPVTLTLASSGTTTAAQTSIPMIFGTLPPMTNVVATATDHGTHYSTVVTTTRGPTDEYVVYTYDSSEDSERDYDIPPRRRRDGNQSRGSQHNTRQNNLESRRPTDQEYEARIRAYEQEIAQLKRDRAAHQARQPPPEPRQQTKNPQNAGMNRIHLLAVGDPYNPIPPFTEEIMAARISRKFKLPTIKAYDGTGDPANHVRTFMNALLLQPVTEAIKCRAFPQTLSGMAQHCLVDEPSPRQERIPDLDRYTKEALKVPDLDQKVAMIALQQGTTDDNFRRSLVKRSPNNMNELQERAGKYIKAEESMRKSQNNQGPTTDSKKRGNDIEYDADNKYLKDEIEFWIRKGKLSKYTRDADRNTRDNDSRDRDNDDHDRRTEPRGPVINMISRGPTAAGLSGNSRKAYAREVMCIVGEPPKRAKTEVALTFDDSDLEGVKFPHDNPLAITPVIGNSSIKRVLVDNGASVDILFYYAYQKMGYADSQLTPSDMPIYGFNGVESKIEGMIQLPVTMGVEPRQATYILNFLVIKASSTYNAILGRTGMHAFKAIASTYHLKIKFPTRNGVGEEKGD
nr:PREDICTED: uncharacterized protein LOC108217734 [Daucus carota subsp. sativus]